MKLLFTLLLVCVVQTYCAAQECWSLDQGWIPCSMSDTLNDKLTGSYYVIVRSERCIKAFDRYQKILWKCNPWESRELSRIMKSTWKPSYQNPDSISIHAIDFPKTEYMGGNEAIVIYFSDRIVGSIDKKTGQFRILGQN